MWISPRPGAKLQATGYDAAGRKQYLYHPAFRAAQEEAKYESLIRFGERLPALRAAMAEHLDRDELDRERVSAVALRLISLGWFRVGSEQYAREGTYGVTTLLRRHVTRARQPRPARLPREARDPGADGARRRRARRGDPRSPRVRPGARVFKYRWEGDLYNLTSKRLNDYVKVYLGEEFSAKDFRTWGGTLLASIHFAERAARRASRDETAQKRVVAAVMRLVAQKLGNTPAVCRASYVSPAVVEQYLDGRTIEDFRPRHLRVVKARDLELSPEEAAMLSLLRSWRIRQARKAA